MLTPAHSGHWPPAAQPTCTHPEDRGSGDACSAWQRPACNPARSCISSTHNQAVVTVTAAHTPAVTPPSNQRPFEPFSLLSGPPHLSLCPAGRAAQPGGPGAVLRPHAGHAAGSLCRPSVGHRALPSAGSRAGSRQEQVARGDLRGHTQEPGPQRADDSTDRHVCTPGRWVCGWVRGCM